MLSYKRMCGYLFALLAVVQMAAFFLYSQTLAHIQIKWIVYLVYWLRNYAEATVPLLAATGALLLYLHGHGRASVALFPILPVLSRVLYFMPDHYLYYLGQGLDSAESLAMGAIVTFIECTLLYLFTLLLLLIAVFVHRRFAKGEKAENAEIRIAPFALENPIAKSVFSIAFAYFCLQIFTEAVRTVSYLIENAGTYTLEEIITIIASFLFHLLALILSQLLCMGYRAYAERHYKKEEGAP